jgi:hypothetical protein
MFGDWTNRIDSLHTEFLESGPVKYLVINDFFTEEWANKLYSDFPIPGKTNAPWKKLDNPVERRFILWEYNEIPSVVRTVEATHSLTFINLIEKITGSYNLLIDPKYQHATGLIAMTRNGKLSTHLDVNINMESKMQRRYTMLIYLNKDWKDEYGGSLQIGDSPNTCKDIMTPAWNTAIIVENSKISYHGVPVPLTCPEGEFRKCLGIYYSSIPLDGADKRYRATWFPSPKQIISPKLQKIYEIMNDRAITEDDLKDWPTWRIDT